MGCLPLGYTHPRRKDERVSSSGVLIKADNVSKKFCRRLKRALWYGAKDLTSELLGRRTRRKGLRTDEFWALRDVSFELTRGECLGLIGRNGAGKSTLLKMLNGLIKPDRGKIMIRGRVGALIELGTGFNPILTGRENIYVNAAVLGIPKGEVDKKLDSVIEFAEIHDFIDTPVQNYSSGMKVRLGFAIAAQLQPDVLLIDEVLAVGDVGFRAKCFNAIDKMTRNAAVILVSHSMATISRICSRIIVMNDGKAVYNDNDVPRGIEYYYSKLNCQTSFLTGNGRATIVKMRMDSKGRKGIQTIRYRDELRVHLWASVDQMITYPTFSIAFHNQELYPISQWSSLYQGVRIKNTGSILHLQIDFNEINLNPSVYYITVTILDGDQREVLAKSFSIEKIQILGDFVAHCPVQLVAQCTVHPPNDQHHHAPSAC